MEAIKIKKLYYSISEVSSITGLKQYVLRYWETEFSQLNPDKNAAGNRIYRSVDVDKIMEIKSLLYERKFTIKGAKQYLKDSAKNNLAIQSSPNQNKVIKLDNSKDLQSFKNIKNGLADIIKLLNSYKD